MPVHVRYAVASVVGLLMAGALYLISVRGEALLVDLQPSLDGFSASNRRSATALHVGHPMLETCAELVFQVDSLGSALLRWLCVTVSSRPLRGRDGEKGTRCEAQFASNPWLPPQL